MLDDDRTRGKCHCKIILIIFSRDNINLDASGAGWILHAVS